MALPEPPKQQFNRTKFKDVVHYICAACTPEELGRVKLHKILYFADMLHFLDTGKPLTGCDYQKQQFGPTARYLGWAQDELRKEMRLDVRSRPYFGFKKQDFISLCEPDRSQLTDREITLIHEVIDFVCARTAKEISELSHTAAWDLVNMGEEIPYYSAFLLIPVETTDEDVAWGERQVRELGLVEP